MKKEFICKIRQLPFWIKKCESSFDNQWITEIKKDRELEKLLLQYQLSLEGKQEKKSSLLSHSNNRQSAIENGPQLHPVSFIGSSFRHFYVNKKKIEKNAMVIFLLMLISLFKICNVYCFCFIFILN